MTLRERRTLKIGEWLRVIESSKRSSTPDLQRKLRPGDYVQYNESSAMGEEFLHIGMVEKII